jgi:hypothetical protein
MLRMDDYQYSSYIMVLNNTCSKLLPHTDR